MDELVVFPFITMHLISSIGAFQGFSNLFIGRGPGEHMAALNSSCKMVPDFQGVPGDKGGLTLVKVLHKTGKE